MLAFGRTLSSAENECATPLKPSLYFLSTKKSGFHISDQKTLFCFRILKSKRYNVYYVALFKHLLHLVVLVAIAEGKQKSLG